MKKRKSGYYWVKFEDQNEIAWYDDMPHPTKGTIGYWHFCCAIKEILEDNDFDWISSKRLTPPKIKHNDSKSYTV